MKRNAMRRNLRQSILKSLGRYLAIVAIIALGSSMFVGLLMTKSDMVATGQKFMDEQNMFDLRLVNMYGWSEEHVAAVARMPGVVDAEGVRYADLIVRLEGTEDDQVYRVYSMPQKINRISLRSGRLPRASDECVIEGYNMTDDIIGTRITVSESNSEETLESITCTSYTIVGYVASPQYMDMNRGTTSVGNGSLANCIYVLPECLDMDYYAQIDVTIPGDYMVYSEEYNSAMDAAGEALKPMLQPIADKRFVQIKREALIAYGDGVRSYEDGLKEFEEGKETALQELEDAYQKLKDAEQLLVDNEAMLHSAEIQLADARVQLEAGEKELASGKEQLAQLKTMALGPLQAIVSGLQEQLDDANAERSVITAQIDALQAQIDALQASLGTDLARYEELNALIPELESQIRSLDAAIWSAQQLRALLSLMPILNAQRIAELDAEIQSLTAQRDAAVVQLDANRAELAELTPRLEEPLAQIDALRRQIEQLEPQLAPIDRRIASIRRSLDPALSSLEEMQAMFADTEAEIAAGEQQLAEARAQIEAMTYQVSTGWVELEKGKQELAQGWVEYEDGKATLERELADAEAELADAKLQLDDAKETLDKMIGADVIILDRNSNVGYNSLESASDIVQGVSRVFPAFFLLVAALVCITTMTRMIDEERTQIGTLKALGYSNGAIISKYLIYAGSGAVLGCGLGVLLGSAVFPMTLWEAYKIMLYITDGITLQVSWVLCGVVVGAYTAVMLFVTWYCCRKALLEVPAELIRPKAPDVGKKILLEKLPFWNKISFLNKVTIRNIFRYRQRLAMMIVGIGGCTALLVTGFGLRDSITNVVDYQFQEVTVYDMTVYFVDGQTPEEQMDFLEDIAADSENAMFYHQSSVDVDFDNKTKEIYLIAARDKVTEFIDLHSGEEIVNVPGLDEVVLSVGVSEAMGIQIGDTVVLRNAELQMMELTVSGIYDNHVDNYAIVAPETVEKQWGLPPAEQMAFVKAVEGQDKHALSAKITGLHDVLNVSVSEDLADMVGNMMEALDLVVWVIVFCAGALAAIVLYNLTNININERIREIATIKVLGFNAGETGAYVFKENLSLSALGSVIGLGLGYLLLLFVMSQIRIDKVWFKAIVSPWSYVISIALTMLAACIVDYIFYFKLDKINMAEALKSVE